MIKKLSPLPNFLVSRYKDWKSKYYSENSNKFIKLGSLGQSPSSMIISCCDSRVHPTSILGAEEGEFFIHRNIANLIPAYSLEDKNNSTSAAIEYAIRELKVAHLIIMGHTNCGGVRGCYNLNVINKDNDYMFVKKWINIIKPALKNISKNISEENQISQLEEESIKNSINNLFTDPDIKQLVNNNNLSIHGLIHDIKTGVLKFLDPNSGKFKKV